MDTPTLIIVLITHWFQDVAKTGTKSFRLRGVANNPIVRAEGVVALVD